MPEYRFHNVYDYARQAWIENGHYARCGHPEYMPCGCYGRKHAGEAVEPARLARLLAEANRCALRPDPESMPRGRVES